MGSPLEDYLRTKLGGPSQDHSFADRLQSTKDKVNSVANPAALWAMQHVPGAQKVAGALAGPELARQAGRAAQRPAQAPAAQSEADLDAEGAADMAEYDRTHAAPTQRVGLSGTSPSPAAYRPQPTVPKNSPDDLMRRAKDMLATQEAQNSHSLQQGPSTGDRNASGGYRSRGSWQSGNIDHMGRPEVDNHDGTTSTVRSMSFGDGPGNEVLIPTAYDGAVHSDRDSIKNYEKTGQHMGKFLSPEHADWEAEKVHNDYEDGKYKLDQREPPEWLRKEMGD